MSPRNAIRQNETARDPLRPSNNPDVAIAQEWFDELDAWYEAHGLLGFDPFDIKQHPWIRGVQRNPLLRKTASALCDAFPHAARRNLGIVPTENPKAFALVAEASLRRYALGGEERYRARAESLLQSLVNQPAKSRGLAWGYPFDVHGAGVDTPAGTPISVVSAIAGNALLCASETLDAAPYEASVRGVAQFFLEELPRLEEADGTCCFAYASTDRRRVHNANLLVAEFLFRAAALLDEPAWREAAAPALAFSLHAQREDGAWPYGEWREGEAFEPALMRIVDHHHTGFVLRSLFGIWRATKDPDVLEALTRGFAFYRTLFRPDGAPRMAHGKYPVDIHACAEAMLCTSMLSERFMPARPLAINALRWTYWNLRDHDTGAPLYRRYPFFTSRITYPRWGFAWTYRALAEYLTYFYPRALPNRD